MRSALTPGSLLADRYRLQDRLIDDGADTSWQALDELLRRPVTVRALPADAHLAEAIIAAARASAAVPDPRFQRVLDADLVDGHVVVVSEWVVATDLARLLADGPLDPEEARRITHEVASALATAAEFGLHHGWLTPEKVLRRDTGQIKVVGLGVDAAIAAAQGEHLDLDDAVGVGALLYAALTGRWPLPMDRARTRLPPAPIESGVVRRPRQVRAGVPSDLDETAVRSLACDDGHTERDDVLRSPQDVMRALTPGLPDADTGTLPVLRTDLEPPSTGSRARRVTLTVAGTAVLALLGLLGWQLGLGTPTEPGPGLPGAVAAPSPPQPTGTVSPPSGALVAVSIRDFDPDGNGSENRDLVTAAVDGDPKTAWLTQTYFNDPRLGRLKPGVGLVLDLGQRRRIRSVSFQLQGIGTDLALGAADAPSASAAGYPIVASVTGAGPSVTLRPPDPVLARYLMVWLTKLPQISPGRFRGGIAEVVINR